MRRDRRPQRRGARLPVGAGPSSLVADCWRIRDEANYFGSGVLIPPVESMLPFVSLRGFYIWRLSPCHGDDAPPLVRSFREGVGAYFGLEYMRVDVGEWDCVEGGAT